MRKILRVTTCGIIWTHDVWGSWLVSHLEPGLVSDAVARGQIGMGCPAAHQGSCPPGGFATCFPPVPIDGSWWSAIPPVPPIHLQKPGPLLAQLSIPVLLLQRPVADFLEGHLEALCQSSPDSTTPLSAVGM